MGDIIRKLKQKGKMNLKWYSNNHSIVIKYFIANTWFLNPLRIYFISLVLVNSWKDSGNTLLFLFCDLFFSKENFQMPSTTLIANKTKT